RTASRFGVNPDRSVTGASSGWSERSSTATTSSPAPTAYSISVVVGLSETIDRGVPSADPPGFWASGPEHAEATSASAARQGMSDRGDNDTGILRESPGTPAGPAAGSAAARDRLSSEAVRTGRGSGGPGLPSHRVPRVPRGRAGTARA